MGEQIFDSFVASGLKSGTVVRNSVGDIVYQAMLESIHSGRLAQGQKINDLELAQQLGVSRTPVREAIQRLKEIGVVESAPNRYTRIIAVDVRAFHDALHVWQALYELLISEVISLIKPSLIRALRRDNEQFCASIEAHDRIAAASATYEFFNRLRELTTNVYLSRGLEAVVHVVRLGTVLRPGSVEIETLARAQVDLIDALEARDEQRAIEALRTSTAAARRVGEDS